MEDKKTYKLKFGEYTKEAFTIDGNYYKEAREIYLNLLDKMLKSDVVVESLKRGLLYLYGDSEKPSEFIHNVSSIAGIIKSVYMEDDILYADVLFSRDMSSFSSLMMDTIELYEKLNSEELDSMFKITYISDGIKEMKLNMFYVNHGIRSMQCVIEYIEKGRLLNEKNINSDK